MTEKEKMLKEMLYDANNDEDLLKERTVVRQFLNHKIFKMSLI